VGSYALPWYLGASFGDTLSVQVQLLEHVAHICSSDDIQDKSCVNLAHKEGIVMKLDAAVDGMLQARAALRSPAGITDPGHISECMQRLAQYTGAVEEHLADLEEQLEIQEMEKFIHYTKTEGRSVNQAETLVKMETGKTKGEIARLKRYVNSSWQIVGVAQSRFNHLQKSTVGQF
jgi:hypothetical protein